MSLPASSFRNQTEPTYLAQGPIEAKIRALLARGHLDPASITMVVSNGVPRTRHGFVSKGATLPERFYAQVAREGGPLPVCADYAHLGTCWLWTGATTLGGNRATNTRYGHINEGSLEGGNWKRSWRTHMLALLLATGFTDVPEVEGELFIPWLYRAKAHYIGQGLEVSHTCDRSLCCHPDHLVWETHAENVYGQKWRQGWRPDGVIL